ncbi:MAG TPA: hypothetical protein VL997_13175 [Dyella sp.]|nr:hypothetical protein [Dyella sp.]
MTEVENLLRADQRISMLVNNAGMGAMAPLLESEVGRMREIIALNIDALTRLTYSELFTVPALPDAADWEAYEDARRKLMPNLSRLEPAARYFDVL